VAMARWQHGTLGGSGVKLGLMGECRGGAAQCWLRRWRLCSAHRGEESIAGDEAVELSCTRQWHYGSSPRGRRRHCARLGTFGKAQWRARDCSCRTGIAGLALALGFGYAAAVRQSSRTTVRHTVLGGGKRQQDREDKATVPRGSAVPPHGLQVGEAF
jgi:hypothetical protein